MLYLLEKYRRGNRAGQRIQEKKRFGFLAGMLLEMTDRQFGREGITKVVHEVAAEAEDGVNNIKFMLYSSFFILHSSFSKFFVK